MDESSGARILAAPLAAAVVAALAWAGSQGGVAVGSIPLFALCAAGALVVQWIAFVPAWLGRTERFFDLVGSVTYLLVTATAIALRPSPDVRAGLLAALVAVWAARLGTFLVKRIHAAGKDGRFDALKTSFPGFLMAWSLQGVWICFTVGAALAAITSARTVPLGVWAWLGLAVWLVGFGIEVVADRQKRDFRADPANADRFITTGLWAWSRHPNYFGEIVLWIGVAMIAAPALQGWQYVTLISPAFVALLLTRGSGIPPLEERADAKWGGEPAYERYKAETPVLVPRPPR